MTEATGAEVTDQTDELSPGLLDDFVGPKVRVLSNLLNARMAEALAPFGMRPGSFSALALISGNPGCSQNQLAQGVGMDKSAVVAIVDDLEGRGLATRVRHPRDRRLHALKITAKGKTFLQRMMAPAAEPGRPIREALSARDMDQLHSLLDRACRALTQAELRVKHASPAKSRSG